MTAARPEHQRLMMGSSNHSFIHQRNTLACAGGHVHEGQECEYACMPPIAYLRDSARLEYVSWRLQACDVVAHQVLSEAGQHLAGTALHPL